jgi:hypothetical protein
MLEQPVTFLPPEVGAGLPSVIIGPLVVLVAGASAESLPALDPVKVGTLMTVPLDEKAVTTNSSLAPDQV